MGSSTTQEWSDDWGACPYDVEVLLAVVAEGGERFITQGWVGSSEFGVGVALRDGTEIDVQDEDGTEIKDGPFVVLAWSLPVFPGGAEQASETGIPGPGRT